MGEMGSPNSAFSAMPPSQHKALKDKRERFALQVLSDIFDGTIEWRGDDTPTAIAHELDGSFTEPKHIAFRLKRSKSQVCQALDDLVGEGKIRVEHKPYRIVLRGDVPAPELAAKPKKGEEKKNEGLLYSKRLSDDQHAFFAKLHSENPETPFVFRAILARHLAADDWGQATENESMAWSRERRSEAKMGVLTSGGYTNEEKRGNSRKNPKPESKSFTPSIDVETFTVQNSELYERRAEQFTVQNGKVIPYTFKKNSAQNGYPYGLDPALDKTSASSSERAPNAAHAQDEATAGDGSRRGTKNPRAEAEAEAAKLRKELEQEILERLHRARATTLGLVVYDPNTIRGLASNVAKLAPNDVAIKETLEWFESKARGFAQKLRKDQQEGRKSIDKPWGWLVNALKDEVQKLLKAEGREDIYNEVKAAAATMGTRR
jgi:hypothetical protein